MRRHVAVAALAVGVIVGLNGGGRAQVQDIEGKAKGEMMMASLEQGLKKARMNGKYEMLLAQIKVPKDAEENKDVKDMGFRNLPEYSGFRDLPAGYWVYVAPYWYIWRDDVNVPKNTRAWGHEQACGAPNTYPNFGDIQTAWASRDPDGQDEWLIAEFEEPIVPISVAVYETYNPGALSKITAFKLDGTEVEVWKGKDPSPADGTKGISIIPIKVDYKVNRIKLHLKSTEVPGWNEVDAIGLRESPNRILWAKTVEASTNYAQETFVATATPRPAPPNDRTIQRLTQLEQDVRDLKQQNRELMQMVKDLQEMLKKDKPKP